MTDLDRRLATAYREAVHQQCSTIGARVHIEIGQDVHDALKARMVKVAPVGYDTLFGFPFVLTEDNGDAIRVCTTTTIH